MRGDVDRFQDKCMPHNVYGTWNQGREEVGSRAKAKAKAASKAQSPTISHPTLNPLFSLHTHVYGEVRKPDLSAALSIPLPLS